MTKDETQQIADDESFEGWLVAAWEKHGDKFDTLKLNEVELELASTICKIFFNDGWYRGGCAGTEKLRQSISEGLDELLGEAE